MKRREKKREKKREKRKEEKSLNNRLFFLNQSNSSSFLNNIFLGSRACHFSTWGPRKTQHRGVLFGKEPCASANYFGCVVFLYCLLLCFVIACWCAHMYVSLLVTLWTAYDYNLFKFTTESSSGDYALLARYSKGVNIIMCVLLHLLWLKIKPFF